MQRAWLDESFEDPLERHWRVSTPGGGIARVEQSVLRLELPQASRRRYSNAQIDSHRSGSQAKRLWQPPLRLEVRARTSHPVQPADQVSEPETGPQRYLRGTAGFGFWNEPLTMAGGWPKLPDAVWFFAASEPSSMRLLPDSPGRGWKAQMVRSHRWGAFIAGVGAAGAIVGTWLGGSEQTALRSIQRMTGAREALLEVNTTEWHDYVIDWQADTVQYWVDGSRVLEALRPPGEPLVFVAWIDNQYAIVSPRGAIRFGLVDCGVQWLELDNIRIFRL